MSDLLEYKCPNCGAAISFDSGEQKMKCPYCESLLELESLKEYDEVLNNKLEDDFTWDTERGEEWHDEGVKVYVCNSCGGEIICDETTAATKCPYCDNPVVMKGNLAGELKPDCVIPFKLDKKAAKNRYLEHIKGKSLLPREFKDKNHIDEIKGVYVPFWLFDADAEADIRYKGSKSNAWEQNNLSYTDTKYYSIVRSGTISFNNVPVDGSSAMPDELMQSIEPFDMEEAVDFQSAYLSGYMADRYDVSAEDNIEIANERIRKETANAFVSDITGYQNLTPEDSSIRLTNAKAKYALYPVWILNTTYKGNKYIFAMNGQTGKMVGDLPMDKGLYRRTALLTGLVEAGIVFGALSALWYFM